MPSIFIGPFETGLERDKEPFLLPQDAFTDLQDAYVFRGKVVKKKGTSLLGRLHTTPALPEALAAVVGGETTYTDTLAQPPVSPGTVIIVISTAAPRTFNDNGNGTLVSTEADVNFGTIDYETGIFTLSLDPALVGAGAVNATDYRTSVRTPVMGLSVYETSVINQEALIAFSQTNAFNFNTSDERFDEIATGAWNSSDSQFMWTANYFKDASNRRLLWAVNNVASTAAGADGIQFYNGATWTSQDAVINAAGDVLRGALIIIPYRNRLVVLNTLEGAVAPGVPVRNQNRARWSQNGTPIYVSAVGGGTVAQQRSWREDIIGRGGFIDAPTAEAIVSAQFFKDTLIVFFERSTWKLRYTGNELLPFIWEQINSELGCESTFSTVSFDDGIFAIGDKRIVSANSTGVNPIDQKIPDEVYNFHNDNVGPTRVHGIRDFFSQLVYWAFPNDDDDGTFPNRVLVLNYVEGSYAFYNDSYTTFGRWVPNVDDYTWATLPYASWADWTVPWGSPRAQSWQPAIIAGNQVGFVQVLDQKASNEVSMDLNGTGASAITNANPAVFRVLNHNRKVGDFLKINYTQAFGTAVVGEAIGTALDNSVQFVTRLANLGVFPGTVEVTLGAITFIDIGNGTLDSTTALASGRIDYDSGEMTLEYAALGANTAVTVDYTWNIINARVFMVTDLPSTDTFTLGSFGVDVATEAAGTADAASTQFTGSLGFTNINPGTIKIILGTNIFLDLADGTLGGGTGASTIDYTSGEIVLNYSVLAADTALTASYTYIISTYAGVDFSAGGVGYTGTGELSVVDNFLVKSKRFSPFVEQESDFRLKYIDMLLNNAGGAFEADAFVEQDENTAATNLTVSSEAEGEGTFNPEKAWKRVFINTTSNFIQLEYTMSNEQRTKKVNYESDWQLNGLLLNVEGAGRLR